MQAIEGRVLLSVSYTSSDLDAYGHPLPAGYEKYGTITDTSIKPIEAPAKLVFDTGRALQILSTDNTLQLAAGPSATTIPQLSSRPNAPASIFLDFGGAAAQTWGSYNVPQTPAYDSDGDPTTFSAGEVADIEQIWQRVSEDYSPFNLNVTTVNPGAFTPGKVQHVIIGGDGSWIGGGGGITFIGGFVVPNLNTSWVFPVNLAAGNPRYVGDAAAHEAGHSFGLVHQSTYINGALSSEYNPGDSSAAPIMGLSYNSQRALWWDGQSDRGATSFQEDMSVIASPLNGFGYAPDDHPDSIWSADALSANNGTLFGAGVIGSTSDVDAFSFSTGDGNVSITVSQVPGGMLDPKLQIWDSAGNLVAASDTGLSETISGYLSAGNYEITVSSHGSYGDVGQYTISGTAPVASVINAPSAPSNLSAQSISTSQINLSWQDNASNETSFIVDRATDPFLSQNLVTDTLPADSTADTATGLSTSTTYYFRVHALNSGGDSSSISISGKTADPVPTDPLPADPAPPTNPTPPADPTPVTPTPPPSDPPPVVTPPTTVPPVTVVPTNPTPPVTTPVTTPITPPSGDSSASIMSRLRKMLLSAWNATMHKQPRASLAVAKRHR